MQPARPPEIADFMDGLRLACAPPDPFVANMGY